MFTQEELNNLLILISNGDIKAKDALAVALLQQKIAGLITPKENAKETGEQTKEGSKE